MKNFDMLDSRFPSVRASNLHRRSVSNLQQPFDYNSLTWFNSLSNDPEVAYAISDRHWPNAHLVVIADHGQLMTALEFDHGLLRHEQCALHCSDGCANFPVASRTEHIVRIWEHSH